jgi:peptidoglycan/LPS O-acetylase OafA/YrhL
MPQYILYFFIALFCAYFFNLHHRWMTVFPSIGSVVLQLMVLPLDFGVLFPDDFVIANAWSLGLEGFFYAIFPFVLLLNARLPVAIVSFCIFLLAYSGSIDPNWMLGFLPGTFFIFICGSWIADPGSSFGREISFFVTLAALLLLIITYTDPAVSFLYSRSVLVGIAIGIPVVFALRNQVRWRYLDEIAGNISYGVFLNQLLVMGAVHRLGLDLSQPGDAAPFVLGGTRISNGLLTVETMAISTILSYVTFLAVERPLIKVRRGFRDTILEKRSPDAIQSNVPEVS